MIFQVRGFNYGKLRRIFFFHDVDICVCLTPCKWMKFYFKKKIIQRKL